MLLSSLTTSYRYPGIQEETAMVALMVMMIMMMMMMVMMITT